MQALRLPRTSRASATHSATPVRSFVKDDGAVLDAQAFEGAAPFGHWRAGKTRRTGILRSGRPEAEREASSADGPGIGTTGILAAGRA